MINPLCKHCEKLPATRSDFCRQCAPGDYQDDLTVLKPEGPLYIAHLEAMNAKLEDALRNIEWVCCSVLIEPTTIIQGVREIADAALRKDNV